MWNLRADYEDGTYIDKDIYDEDASDRRQYELEEKVDEIIKGADDD